MLGKELNWSTYHLSKSSKNPGSKDVQLKLPDDTQEQESTLAMTDVQPVLKFQYAIFEMIRRRFPCPDQASNDVSEKLLMKELDREEYADWVALDGLQDSKEMGWSTSCGSIWR